MNIYVDGSNVTLNVAINTASTVNWAITGCTLSDTVNAKYCVERCGMTKHCEVGIARKKELDKLKIKVQFT